MSPVDFKESKMYKNLLICAGLVFLLAGCNASNSPKPTTQSGVSVSSNTNPEAKPEPAVLEGKAVISDACRMGNAPMCKSFADSMYAKKDFVSAIAAYDMNCAIKQHIPSCVKMAEMFEKGEGVAKNIPNAIDIHKRSCYGGYKPSCKDMKRLGFNGD